MVEVLARAARRGKRIKQCILSPEYGLMCV